EKAGDVRDTSLRVPPGVTGPVILAKVFSRQGVEEDERARQIEAAAEAFLLTNQNDELRLLEAAAYAQVRRILTGRKTAAKLVDDKGETLVDKGATLTDDIFDSVPRRYWTELVVDGTEERARQVIAAFEAQRKEILQKTEEKIARLKKGDELPPGVIKMVKVYVAIKRKLSVGDKMAGRHGNKGVVSRILPEEDMPYLPDGTPVDILHTPHGVPYRMNFGQDLEPHLDWAARGIGRKLEELANTAGAAAARKELEANYGDEDFG